MRDRPVIVFFAGFACGLVFLAALLRWSGGLHAKASARPSEPRESQTLPVPKPALQPDIRRAPDPTPEQPRLGIPVQGVRADQLRDDFEETRGGRRHEAIDIMAPRGTPVLAADAGTVVKLFLSKPGGLTVYEFDDSQTYCYYYAHLDSYAPGVKEGTLLRKGEILGYVGSTGNAPPDAPHLHFAIFKLGPDRHWWEGMPIDPYGLLR